MEKELKVIEIPASGKRNWSGGAYCIAFVYSKNNGNFIVKGYFGEVESYIKDNYIRYFVNYTLWSVIGFRSIWRFWDDRYYIIQPHRRREKSTRYYSTKPNYKWRITNFSQKDDKVNINFRRFPKRWIKEFDNLK